MKRRQAAAALGAAALGSCLPDIVGQCPSAHALGAADQLFARFAKSQGFSADFVEEKHIALLKEPLKNLGRVYFARPGSFARHIDKPFRSAVFLVGTTLILWDESGQRRVALDEHPSAFALATSFLSLLQGRRTTLEANYEVRFSGSSEGDWKLELAPRTEALRHLVTRLEFTGANLSVSSMSVHETSGDRSIAQFANARPNRHYTDAEKARFFVPPKS